MEEKVIKAGKFLFLSYSHKDLELVKRDVELLHGKGVRIWYDTNMKPGENWKDRAYEMFSHENCVGVVFYNSPYSYISEACNEERIAAIKKREKDPTFGIYGVSVGKVLTKDYLSAAGALAAQLNTEEAWRNFVAAGDTMSKLFENEKLVILRGDDDSHIAEIEKLAFEKNCVASVEAFNSRFANTKRIQSIQFGHFIASDAAARINGKDRNSRIRRGETDEVLMVDGSPKKVVPLYWTALDMHDNTAVLLCRSNIAVWPYDNETRTFISEAFKDLAFDEKEKELFLSPPRFLNKNDIDALRRQYTNADDVTARLANDVVETKRHWWTDIDGLYGCWKQTVYCGNLFEMGLPVEKEKGIRPVIELNANRLEGYLK